MKCAEQFADITANTAVTLLESRQVFLGRSIINVLQRIFFYETKPFWAISSLGMKLRTMFISEEV